MSHTPSKHLKPAVTYQTGSRDSSQDSDRSRSSANTDSSYESGDGMEHRDGEDSRRAEYHRVPDHPSHLIKSTISANGKVQIHDHKKGRYDAKEKVSFETTETHRATTRREERIRREKEARHRAKREDR